MTSGVAPLLECYESATGQKQIQCVVVDRAGRAVEFLARLHQAGRQVVTLLRSEQYEGEGAFEQGGAWHPWRYNRHGPLICEVASARFALPRPDLLDAPVEGEGALIGDWRKVVPVEGADAIAPEGGRADLAEGQREFWEEDWQAVPAPAAPTTPKLLAVITTGHGMDAVELAHPSFRRWT